MSPMMPLVWAAVTHSADCRGSSAPECGRAFDPQDASTFDTGRKKSWRRWAVPPYGFRLYLPALLVSFWIYAFSTPADPIVWTGLCLLLSLSVVGILLWVVLLLG